MAVNRTSMTRQSCLRGNLSDFDISGADLRAMSLSRESLKSFFVSSARDSRECIWTNDRWTTRVANDDE